MPVKARADFAASHICPGELPLARPVERVAAFDAVGKAAPSSAPGVLRLSRDECFPEDRGSTERPHRVHNVADTVRAGDQRAIEGRRSEARLGILGSIIWQGGKAERVLAVPIDKQGWDEEESIRKG